MRWRGGRRSENIDDLRGAGPVRMGAAGAPLLLRLVPLLLRTRGGRVLLVGAVVVGVVAHLLGIDVLSLLGGAAPAPGARSARAVDPAQQELVDFSAVVLADTEDTWGAIFRAGGSEYAVPRLVLFSGSVNSACGFADAAVGPFYCPGDRKVYLDLAFFDELHNRFGAPGDFAQAYVIAHEVGHHVQNLLGTAARVHAARNSASEVESNRLSVRLELQADCYAGVWGNRANRERQLLEPGDLEEALVAAAAIGDDRLQHEAGGRVVPDSFTHGTSEQRVQWFRTGFEAGDPARCDTFAAP